MVVRSPDPFHASDQTRDVLLDVANERRSQIIKGWTPEHDDNHITADMIRLSLHRLVRAQRDPSYSGTRKFLIQGIAILVSAVEVIDRRLR